MSTLKVNTLEEATSGGATFFTAKAWLNFNGTGTVAILADGNVSSLTDRGTGVYTASLTTNTSTSNQTVSGSAIGAANVSYNASGVGRDSNVTKATSNFGMYVAKNNGSSAGPEFDSADVSVVVMA